MADNLLRMLCPDCGRRIKYPPEDIRTDALCPRCDTWAVPEGDRAVATGLKQCRHELPIGHSAFQTRDQFLHCDFERFLLLQPHNRLDLAIVLKRLIAWIGGVAVCGSQQMFKTRQSAQSGHGALQEAPSCR